MTRQEKVWFITGASRGFGKIWTRAVLERGDKVAATARDLSSLHDLRSGFGDALLPVELDVTDHDRTGRAVREAHDHFGRLDVMLSSAGYGLLGAIEEVDLDDARANFETNVMGTLSTIQAAVPIMREQGSGHILAVSSVGGLVALPLGGVYQATKFAIEGLLQTLELEIADFGVRVTLIEPGPFATDFMSENSLRHARSIAAYDPARKALADALPPELFGKPEETIPLLLRAVDAERPPLHLMLGNSLLPKVKEVYTERMRCWDTWSAIGNE